MRPVTAARGFCIVCLAAWVGAQVRADFSPLACVFLLQLSRRHLPALCSCMPCPHTPGLAPDCTDADANANGEQDRSEFLHLYAFDVQDDNPSWQAYVAEDQEPPVSIFFPNITVPDSGLTERKSSLDGGCLLPADLSCSARLHPSVGVFSASVPVSVSASVPWFAPGAARSHEIAKMLTRVHAMPTRADTLKKSPPCLLGSSGVSTSAWGI